MLVLCSEDDSFRQPFERIPGKGLGSDSPLGNSRAFTVGNAS